MPASTQVGPCARVRRAMATGRELIRREAGLLCGLDRYRACAAQVRPPGRASAASPDDSAILIDNTAAPWETADTSGCLTKIG